MSSGLRRICFLLLLGLMLLSVGCSRNEEVTQPAAVLQPVQNQDQSVRPFLRDALPLQEVESAAEALAVWRQYSASNPTLLLLSNEPFLQPVPESLRPEVARLISLEPQATIAARSTLRRPDPLLLPTMTVDAALRAGWFGQLIWALPLADPETPLEAERFRQQLLQGGMATQAEADTLTRDDSHLKGVLRRTPLLAAPLSKLPPASGPVILHIDQSYFQQLYRNEIKTPLLSLVHATLAELRNRNIPVLAVTFSAGNLDGRISLDVRFIGDLLQGFVEHPETFDQPVPMRWKRLAEILYLDNFFQKEKKLELALELAKEAPDSGWAAFLLYRCYAENRKGTEALAALDRAVTLDPVYGLEYLTLSDRAFDRQRPDEGGRMLELAQALYPENPHVRLRLAELQADRGDVAGAREKIETLRRLPWSDVYFSEMPQTLDRMLEHLVDRKNTSG